jgi:hypothetical protein
MRPPMLGRDTCLTRSANSNVKLIQNSHCRHAQSNV